MKKNKIKTTKDVFTELFTACTLWTTRPCGDITPGLLGSKRLFTTLAIPTTEPPTVWIFSLSTET